MIKKVKTGYSVRLYYYENGKRKSISKTFIQKHLATKWETEMKITIQTVGHPKHSEKTFCDYFWQWFNIYRKQNLAPATVDRYRTIHSTLTKYFENIMLDDMNRLKYQEFINQYADDHSKNSVSKIHNAVKAAINDAVEDDLIPKNFTTRITIYGNDGVDPDKKFLNKIDAEKLMVDLVDKVDVYNISLPMIYTSLMTGLRLAEVQGLTEGDFFPEFKRIQVNKTYDHNMRSENPFKPTKNKSSNRVVDIPDVLVDFLNKLITMQHQFNPKANPHKFIFMNNRGDIPSSNAVNKALRHELTIIKANKTITFHGLRHTHASYLLACGSKLEYVSKRLGHSSVETTMKVYAHMLKETETNEVEKAMKFLNGSELHIHKESVNH